MTALSSCSVGVAVVVCFLSKMWKRVEKNITEQATHRECKKDIREVLALVFTSHKVDIHRVNQKNRYDLNEECRYERLDK